MAIEKVKYSTENGAAVEMVIDGEKYTVNIGDGMLLYGLSDWIAGGGVIEPFYTITGAEFNRPDRDDVISVYTKEAGRVNITEKDNPFHWQAYLNWAAGGGVVGPFVDRGKEAREAAEAEAVKAQKRKELLDAMIESGVTPESVKAGKRIQ